MPISAKLFKIEVYPTMFPVTIDPLNMGIGDDFRLRTKVEMLGMGEYSEKSLEKLKVTHDVGRKFEGVAYSSEHGRLEDLVSIAEEKEFPVFVFPEKDYLFSAFSSKEMFNSAFKRLRQYTGLLEKTEGKYLSVSPIKLDLQKIKDSYTRDAMGPKVMGGWFRELNITNVDVAYIGGGGVDDSDDWFRYETSGKISALRLDFPGENPEEEPLRLLITSDASIISYKHLPENYLLKLFVPIIEFIKLSIE